MNNSVKERIKQNERLYSFVKILRRLQYHHLDKFIFCFRMIKRKIFGSAISKNDIRKFKNIHIGERCFIVATGPSLTLKDLRLLKNEITFGMNSLCKIFEELGWETTYFGVQDYEVYRLLEDKISRLKHSTVFTADILKKRYKLKNEYVQYPLNLLNHSVSYNHSYNTTFSDDSYMVVYDGYTITYSLLQIAVYMGFKEIYLIGADCNYSKNINERNFINIGKVDITFDKAGERMLYSYKIAKEYADNNKVKIYNATRGGMLEVFPRVDLDDVLKEDVKL